MVLFKINMWGENNPGGPEGDTVTVDEQLLNTEY